MTELFAQAVFWLKSRLRDFSPIRALWTAKRTNDGCRYEPNEKTGFSIHPAFFLVGVFYALIGRLPLFLMSVIVALEHELAHALTAARLGYRLNRIVLMPYGAVIDGDLRDISLKDEIAVALAGPLCNLATAAAFVALWWFYPTAYAYTDTACFISASIALVNLLPAYPLDGGRILEGVLIACFSSDEQRKGKGRKRRLPSAEARAKSVCRIVALCFSVALLAAFFVLLGRGERNYTLPVFALFLGLGSFPSGRNATYAKVNFSNVSSLEHGLEIRRVAVLADAPVKSVFRYLCKGKYLILEIYDRGERYLGSIKQSELAAFFACSSPYSKIGEILLKTLKNQEKLRKR